jgi:hypothetical protein
MASVVSGLILKLGGGCEFGQNEIAHSLRAQSQASHRADSETYIPVLSKCLTSGGGQQRLDEETETFIVTESKQTS